MNVRVEAQSDVFSVNRFYTESGEDPYDKINWKRRSAIIKDFEGNIVFKQDDIEAPDFWSDTALNIVANKYFFGEGEERENSIAALINRVVVTIAAWGKQAGYFETKEETQAFGDELWHILANQIASFNSPVWFNIGVRKDPQCSACFILEVKDDMESILENARIEGDLFKWGSGCGSNRSAIRSYREKLSGGGVPSGPLSFMRIYDKVADVVKSGGKTRRAAKAEILNVDHPDIIDFIWCKYNEEKKAQALIQAGYDSSIAGEAYSTVDFQNANLSISVPDEFMKAIVDDAEWNLIARTTGETIETVKARDIMKAICEAAWGCGDPGMFYDTTINKWNPVKNSGRINSFNPCGEFTFLDNSACNLASINLLKFLDDNGRFDCKAFAHTVDIMVLAQEIIVSSAGYPTPEIKDMSARFRPLGLGFSNLGATIMSLGHSYDSDEGRAYAGAIAALLGGEAYAQSARIASRVGTFKEYSNNEESFLDVIRKHKTASEDHARRYKEHLHSFLLNGSGYEFEKVWRQAEELGVAYGFRNAQVTNVAPTGTISFMMDCVTTGIEPELLLVKYKNLVGGGQISMINPLVAPTLLRLGYTIEQTADITKHIAENDTIEGANHIKEEHLAVFDCSFKPVNGERSIAPIAHIKMMAAVQPFVSGAISKTVNLPNDATVDDIRDIYIQAWKYGLKDVALYRDGSKGVQPLNGSKNNAPASHQERIPLADTAQSVRHKFEIASHKFYLHIGLYSDGRPGEIFIKTSKEGAFISGVLDAFAQATSYALQWGCPLKVIVEKMLHTHYEPYGITSNPDIRFAKSITDYLARFLAKNFLDKKDWPPALLTKIDLENEPENSNNKQDVQRVDLPPCRECGTQMIAIGSCQMCPNCGEHTGSCE